MLRLLDAIRQWYRETRSGRGFVWYSAAGRRSSRGTKLDPGEYQIPDFSNGDDFSPPLYADLCAFDVEDLGYHVRLRQWGRVGGARDAAKCSHFRLVYAYPDFDRPTKVMELDLEEATERSRYISPYELPYEGRQEETFVLHQQLYAGARDWSFEHVTMRAFTPDRITAPLTFLDFWRGALRRYCITQLSVADVKIQVILSGFDDEEAVKMIGRLVPIAGNARLIEWHDGASRRLQAKIDRLIASQPK